LQQPRHLAVNGFDTESIALRQCRPSASERDTCQHPLQPGGDHPAGGRSMVPHRGGYAPL